MMRFIDSSTIAKTLGVVGYDGYLASSVGSLFVQMQTALNAIPVAATGHVAIRAEEPPATARAAKPKAKRKHDDPGLDQ